MKQKSPAEGRIDLWGLLAGRFAGHDGPPRSRGAVDRAFGGGHFHLHRAATGSPWTRWGSRMRRRKFIVGLSGADIASRCPAAPTRWSSDTARSHYGAYRLSRDQPFVVRRRGYGASGATLRPVVLRLRAHTPFHSITSSARARSVGGISRPSVFAVLRLIDSSNLAGARTGRSAGFAPLRISSM